MSKYLVDIAYEFQAADSEHALEAVARFCALAEDDTLIGGCNVVNVQLTPEATPRDE